MRMPRDAITVLDDAAHSFDGFFYSNPLFSPFRQLTPSDYYYFPIRTRRCITHARRRCFSSREFSVSPERPQKRKCGFPGPRYGTDRKRVRRRAFAATCNRRRRRDFNARAYGQCRRCTVQNLR